MLKVTVAEGFVQIVFVEAVSELKLNRSGLRFVGLIDDFDWKQDLITLAQKSRRVRLYHQVLAGGHFVDQHSSSQLRVVSQSHEFPRCQRLRNLELDVYFAIFVFG